MNKKTILACVIVIFIIGFALFAFKVGKPNTSTEYDFFHAYLSPATYSPIIEDENKFDEWLSSINAKLKSNKTIGSDSIYGSRQWLIYFDTYKDKNITDLQELKVTLTEKTNKSRDSILINLKGIDNEEIRDYTVAYTLIDKDNNKYNLTDKFTLVLRDSIPVYIELLKSDSGIYSLN